MYFTSGSDRAFEQLMQGKRGFDHYDSGEAVTPEDCGTCRLYRPHWKYQFRVYAECPYQQGRPTAYDAVTFRVKGVENKPCVLPHQSSVNFKLLIFLIYFSNLTIILFISAMIVSGAAVIIVFSATALIIKSFLSGLAHTANGHSV